jgi:hypothetical protein
MRTQEQLIRQGVLAKQDNQVELLQDYEFKSPSQATGLLLPSRWSHIGPGLARFHLCAGGPPLAIRGRIGIGTGIGIGGKADDIRHTATLG